jgi:hypothetical protein
MFGSRHAKERIMTAADAAPGENDSAVEVAATTKMIVPRMAFGISPAAAASK